MSKVLANGTGWIPQEIGTNYIFNSQLQLVEVNRISSTTMDLGSNRMGILSDMKFELIKRKNFTTSMQEQEKLIREYIQQTENNFRNKFWKSARNIDNWISLSKNKLALRNLIKSRIGQKQLAEIDSKLSNLHKVGENVFLEEEKAAVLFKRWSAGSKVAIATGVVLIVGVFVYDLLHDSNSNQSMLPKDNEKDIADMVNEAEENETYLNNVLSYATEVGCALPKTNSQLD